MPNSLGVDAEKERRLRWNCRRGLLELDLTLGVFLDNVLPTLTQDQVAEFESLLTHEDNDIWAYLTRRKTCPDPSLAGMVELLCVVPREAA